MLRRLLLFVPAVVAEMLQHPHLDPRATCKQDDCYRAVMHTTGRYVTRGGTMDCSSYQIATVTPATSTVTVTATATFSSTQTSSVTVTTATTTTPLVRATATSTTGTITTTSFIVAKRQMTSKASTFPDYATSACMGNASRYSSACSCLGVTASTVTVAAPVTTTTVSTSVTSSTTTTVTASTETDTSTADLTVTTTVTTTGVIATSTAVVQAYALQVVGGVYNGQYLISRTDPGQTGDNILLGFQPSLAAADRFFTAGSSIASVNHPGNFLESYSDGGSYVLLAMPGQSDQQPLKCAIQPDNTLLCAENTNPSNNVFRYCEIVGGVDNLAITDSANPCIAANGTPSPAIKLKIIPFA